MFTTPKKQYADMRDVPAKPSTVVADLQVNLSVSGLPFAASYHSLLLGLSLS